MIQMGRSNHHLGCRNCARQDHGTGHWSERTLKGDGKVYSKRQARISGGLLHRFNQTLLQCAPEEGGGRVRRGRENERGLNIPQSIYIYTY